MSVNLIENYVNNSGMNKSQYRNQTSYLNSYQVSNNVERIISNDTVTIGNKKVKKKNILLGLGVLALGTIGVVVGVKFHNTNTLEKAQKTFQKVFLRDDISLEETKAILSRYKEIEKIENKEDYIQALFAEAKKNYGLEHTSISCKIEDLGKFKLGTSDGYGDVTINKNAKRKGLINFIHHELRHTKQNDMMLSTNPEKYAKSIFNRASTLKILKEKDSYYKQLCEHMKKQLPDATQEDIDEMATMMLMDKYIKSLSTEAKAKGLGTKSYSDKHKDYIEELFSAHENYTFGDGISGILEYRNNFLEKDARFAGENMEKVIRKTKLEN